MWADLKELWRFRELLLTMVERDLKIRYKNSALGFFWSLINPLLTVMVMTFVLETFIYRDVQNLSAYVLASYLPFIFLQLAVMDSAQTILVAMPLIKKIYFPRELLPLSSVIANFIHLVLAMLVFFAYLIVVWLLHPPYRMEFFPSPPSAMLLPLLLVIAFALALGLGFIISALNTFYEDVKYLVSIALYLLFFLCPIMYFSEQVANSSLNAGNGILYKLYFLNPIASISDAFRKTLVRAPEAVPTKLGPMAPLPLNWAYVAFTAVLSFAILIGGYMLFNRLKWKFVERP